jgi:hypothetical protein
MVQSGAFFIFGLNATLGEAGNGQIKISRTEISSTAKEPILEELDRLNINDRTVYPFIENTARYIRSKFAKS